MVFFCGANVAFLLLGYNSYFCFLGAVSRYALQSFAALHSAKGFPFLSGLSLPRGPTCLTASEVRD